MRAKYGIDLVIYERMHTEQGGRCAICGNPPRKGTKLGVDHCHRTGLVRGLLCDLCNRAIGLLYDDPNRCFKAAMYLRRKDRSKNDEAQIELPDRPRAA